MSTRLLIDVAPLREAFERSGLTAPEVAKRCGWLDTRRRSTGDGSRLKRLLGIYPVRRYGSLPPAPVTQIDVDRAEKIADAIGVERWEVGA